VGADRHGPVPALVPAILVFCTIGVFSLRNAEFDIYFMALFGALGMSSPSWL